MRLPNRVGTVCRLSGKRRRPYMARVYTPNGYVILGYYRMKSEAITALLQASIRTVYNPTSPVSTLEDMYLKWSEQHFQRVQGQSITAYKRAWSCLSSLWRLPIRTITVTMVEDAVAREDPARGTRMTIKSLLSQVFRYAMAHDQAEKNIGELIDIEKQSKQRTVTRKVFTEDEVRDLFQSEDPVDMAVLVGIYTGMRPGELLALKRSEVDLDAMQLRIAGSKTAAGKNRTVPIHPAIQATLSRIVTSSAMETVMVNRLGKVLNYELYYDRLQKMGHTPHDTRHTFASYARASGLDPLAVKRILGHASGDLTEHVYTHTSDPFIKKEMSKFFIV